MFFRPLLKIARRMKDSFHLSQIAGKIARKGDNSRLTSYDVINAYRFLLGRLQENAQVVLDKLQLKNFKNLRDEIIGCAEYKDKLSTTLPIFDVYQESPKIDINITSEKRQQLFNHIQKNWTDFGSAEPWWSVLTHPQYKTANISDTARDEFYKSGSSACRHIRATLTRCGLRMNFDQLNCLEFGCGAGRNLVHLARMFAHVTGVDISRPHLDKAAMAMDRYGLDNTGLLRLSDIADIDGYDKYDFIYSIIVLQHNPPPLIAEIIARLCNRLNRNGLFLFQVPDSIHGYEFDITAYLDNLSQETAMEMHALPQSEVNKIIAANDCRILEIHPDKDTGTHRICSYNYLVQKMA